MSKQKLKQVKIKGNVRFVLCCILMAFVLLGSLCVSIYDQQISLIEWPQDYENTIGVLSQVITSIISLVVSTIGIAISLQNEDYFGVKITKLYSLRVKFHYSILAIIIISILLCVVNLCFFMANLHIAAIGAALGALLFLFQVLIVEIPIMTKNEKAMIGIVKDRFIFCYLKEENLPLDLKNALRYLLFKSNLTNLYLNLKDKKDDKYNKHLLMTLLDVQQHLAKDIKDTYEGNEVRVVADSLLNNVLDVLFRKIDISDDSYLEVVQQRHMLTRVLFYIHDLPTMTHTWLEKIQGLIQCLEFASVDTVQWDDLVSEILTILVARTVQEGDFSIIKAIRRQISSSEYCLDKESPLLDFFAIISMYLYYLRCCDPDVPGDLKEKISEFINESGIIEEKTKISSWKALFAKAAEEFNVNYDAMVALSAKVSNTMEYYLFGNGAKFVILDKAFFSRWYLSHLFNARRIPEIKCEELCNTYPDIKSYLKDFGKRCTDENGDFSPTEEMIRIVDFYSDENEHFVLFKISEERTRNFFTFINNLRLEDLSREIAQAGQVDNAAFAQKIRTHIEDAVSNEWGFDPSLSIENGSRYFSIIFEKYPEAINFEETIEKYCVDSVFSDLRRTLDRTEVFNNQDFEDAIRSILLKTPKYTTSSTKKTIPYFFIQDPELQNLFFSLNETMNEIESRILGNMFLLLDNSFRFNLEIEKVEINRLSEEEIAKRVDECQRADGQFVYDGVFLPRETVSNFIKERFVVLTVIIKHQMQSSKDKIFKLKPYSKGKED